MGNWNQKVADTVNMCARAQWRIFEKCKKLRHGSEVGHIFNWPRRDYKVMYKLSLSNKGKRAHRQQQTTEDTVIVMVLIPAQHYEN